MTHRRNFIAARALLTILIVALAVRPAASQEGEAPASPSPTVGRVLFVDRERGDDEAAGTADDPFRTIGRAAAAAQPGDRVEIAAGDYEEAVWIERSGTEAAPIVFAAAPDADVRVQDYPLTIAADFVVLEGLTVESAQDEGRGGVFITGGRGIELRNVNARENEGGGVRVKPVAAPVVDLLIRGGTFEDNDGAGIAATGEEQELRRLTIEGVTVDDNNGDGIQVERATDVTIAGAVATNNGEGEERNGVFLKNVTGARVRDVLARDNGHNGVALRTVEDVLIVRSISTGNDHHGFDSIEGVRNVAFVNNVSYANGDAPDDKGLYVTATEGIRIVNNIFADNVGDQLAFSDEGGKVSDISSDYNLFWREDGERLIRWFDEYFEELPAYQAASGLDAASILAMPGFQNPDEGNFDLRPDSPAIDAGTAVDGVTTDFTGSAPDIGAVERRDE